MANQNQNYKEELESAAEFLLDLKDEFFSGNPDELSEIEHDMNHFKQYCNFADLIYQVICYGERDSVVLAMIPYRHLSFIAFSEGNIYLKENEIYQVFAIEVFTTLDRLMFTEGYKDDVPSHLFSRSFDLNEDTPEEIYERLNKDISNQ